MLKFFRQIRQQLISENSFSKYLLYAAGEILLVVIGILIALQINNWNEDNKNRYAEKGILQGIHDNLEEDDKTLTQTIQRFELTNMAIKRMFQTTPIPDDSLIHIMARATGRRIFIPITTAFEKSMSSGNFDLISEDSIANRIQRLYAFEYNTTNQAHIIIEEIHYRLRYYNEIYEGFDLTQAKRAQAFYNTSIFLPWNKDNLRPIIIQSKEVLATFKNFHANIEILLGLYKKIQQNNQSTRAMIKYYLAEAF